MLGAVSPGYELFGHTIAPYSWISQPVSGLGLGVTGPTMNAAFIVGGLLVLVGTLATARAWWRRGGLGRTAVVLMVLSGVGMIVCGAFTLESMMLHLSGFLLAVPLPAVGFVLAGLAVRLESPTLGLIGIGGGAASLVLFAIFMGIFDATGAGGNVGVAGLVQRALILVTLATLSALAVGVARIGAPTRTRVTADLQGV
ncbi:hypothetical protein GCM10009775_05340 [Microbacterium aoyamense]|uniref:DUF998 domain-containing protein n=1 Tax=Microbacterium aoyamense TaxID=344166 RepID=A0ABP5AM48_9MICO